MQVKKLLEVTLYFKLASFTAIANGLCYELLTIIEKIENQVLRIDQDSPTDLKVANYHNRSSTLGSINSSPYLQKGSTPSKSPDQLAKKNSQIETRDSLEKRKSPVDRKSPIGSLELTSEKSYEKYHIQIFVAHSSLIPLGNSKSFS